MPSWKKVIVSGSDASLNSLNVATNVVAQSFTGSLLGTSSYAVNADFLDGKDSTVFATTGSNIFIGNQTVTGSLFTTGSNTLVGSTSLTGSLSITGSTLQTGNNTLIGTTTLSGSITISGSTTPGSPTASVQIYGDIRQSGYHRFDPVSTNIDTSISASYIYVSGSTNDLYFSQNSNGFNNVTRLRWIEGNLYTGLLHGGLITAATGSTVFNVSSGSGVIVDLNASIADDPYPTINYLNWGNYTNIPITYLTSSIQTFVGIDANGQVIQQTSPYVNGEYNTQILLGTVLHQNQATVNASITYPSLGYGYKQRTYDFVKAFGPLKLSGLTIVPSSSLGLNVGSGTAYADGRNYQTDPNNPSYITDPGTTVSKIFRYYQSGSAFVQDTNGGVGYTVIDPANYNPNGSGSLTPVPGTGINREWSIQRVFWYPNSATKGIVVYYGSATYANAVDAAANISYESFQEVENTKQNAVYLGALLLRNDATFADSTSYRILPGGLFRNVGGSGGGGNISTLLLSQLGDVTISGPTDGQALVYNSSTLKWVNASAISASISGNAATATTASFATTASYVLNAVSASFASSALSSSYSVTSSFAPTAISSSYALTASYALSTDGFGETTKLFQTTASTTWSFNHNLGEQYPQIDIYDGSNKIVIPSEIEAVDQNNMLIYFASPQTGVAAASVGGIASVQTASYADTFTINTTTLKTNRNTDVDTGTEVVSTVSTAFYDSAFFDYRIKSGSNLRAGTVTAVWDGTNVEYTDVSTNDLGNTLAVTMSVDISASFARLLATTTTNNWDVKTFVRMI